jgi:Skp family chaperone for outer membrane proteins
MRSARLLAVALVLAAVPLVGAASANADLKVGVVDIVAVTMTYARVTDANEALQTEQTALAKQSDAKLKDLEVQRGVRETFEKKSAEWKRANEALMKGIADYQGWLALEKAKIEVKHRDVLLDIYTEIAAAVAKVAAEKKLDIVFTKAFLSPPQIDLETAQGLEDLKARILNQRVLYPTVTVDLTKDVEAALNAGYKSTTPAPAATPTAAAPKAK